MSYGFPKMHKRTYEKKHLRSVHKGDVRACLSYIGTNVDQFVNKRVCLCVMIAGDEPDLILLTEVIPEAQVTPISPAQQSLPGYVM